MFRGKDGSNVFELPKEHGVSDSDPTPLKMVNKNKFKSYKSYREFVLNSTRDESLLAGFFNDYEAVKKEIEETKDQKFVQQIKHQTNQIQHQIQIKMEQMEQMEQMEKKMEDEEIKAEIKRQLDKVKTYHDNSDQVISFLRSDVNGKIRKLAKDMSKKTNDVKEELKKFLLDEYNSYGIHRRQAELRRIKEAAIASKKISSSSSPAPLTETEILKKITHQARNDTPATTLTGELPTMCCIMYDRVTNIFHFGRSGKKDKDLTKLNDLSDGHKDSIIFHLNQVDNGDNAYGVNCAEIDCLIKLLAKRNQQGKLTKIAPNEVYSYAYTTIGKNPTLPCYTCNGWTKALFIKCYRPITEKFE